ncbi:Lrp/AsnC family transcriptional regulator [Candidatus Pacearchaeota archaeon]|nr:Lrp/AsnC family transcriptional regulator [Candidatus Pacearchaeota archaeon]
MKLTKNEKKTLKLLLENAKISDSAIAKKLKISSQAVGKIRKKLETTVIESYTVNLNYSKLGINVFAIALARLTPDGLDKGELEVEQKLLNQANIIQIHRLPNQSTTHIILYGFKDLNELDNFFHSTKKKNELHRFIENKDLFTFSNHSLIKNSPIQLFNQTIEEIGTQSNNNKNGFTEIEHFKRRLKK